MARAPLMLLLCLLAPAAALAGETRAGMVVRYTPAPVVAEPGTEAEIESYIHAVLRRVAEDQTYPREALDHDWEGAARVDLTIGRDGQVKAAKLVRSTGFSVLDAEAVAKVRGLPELPLPPRVLRGREFTFGVPVVFRLDVRDPSEAELFNP